MQPRIPIDVDEATGVWQTDGLPMMYVPRHFFNNLHNAVEAALGREKYESILFDSGHTSAHFWCTEEAKTHGLQSVDVFSHYLERLSLRGWGQFAFIEERLQTDGFAQIGLQNSAFVLHRKAFALSCAQTCCFICDGWFAGAADWVAPEHTHVAREIACASQGAAQCVFEITRS